MYAIARVEEDRDRIMVPRLAATSGEDALRQYRDWLFENNPAGDKDRFSGIRDGRLFVRGNLYYAGTLEHWPTCGASGEGDCDCVAYVRETA